MLEVTTATDQHEQNGRIEVFHRIILDDLKLSPTMRSAGLDMEFWSAVLPSIGYIRNVSPSSTLGKVTPYEATNLTFHTFDQLAPRVYY
jgi:hypothetical protein